MTDIKQVPSGTGQARVVPEPFSEATKTGLSAINSTVLATCTLVGLGLSVYADLSKGLLPAIAGWVALLAWVGSLTMALFLAGRSTGTLGFTSSVLHGLRMARGNLGFTVVVLLLTAGAAFTTWSRSKPQGAGVLASMFRSVERIQRDTEQIKAVVSRSVPPAQALARLGFTSSDEDVCRAINTGQADALKLMAQLRTAPLRIAVPQGGGYNTVCIEPLLLSQPAAGSLAAAVATLPLATQDIDRRYLVMRFGEGDPGPVDLPLLLRTTGAEPIGRTTLVSLLATPLMLAVWGGNLEAVQALLTMGANPNTASKFVATAGRSMYSLYVKPLSEARRLGRTALADALAGAGGQPGVVRKPYTDARAD